MSFASRCKRLHPDYIASCWKKEVKQRIGPFEIIV